MCMVVAFTSFKSTNCIVVFLVVQRIRNQFNLEIGGTLHISEMRRNIILFFIEHVHENIYPSLVLVQPRKTRPA